MRVSGCGTAEIQVHFHGRAQNSWDGSEACNSKKKSTFRHVEKFGRERFRHPIVSISILILNAPKFEVRSQEDTLKQERCARRDAWEKAKSIRNLKEKDKATFCSPQEVRCLPVPS